MILTQDEISGLSIDLDPFATAVGQPLETCIFVHVNLVRPSEATLFVAEDIVVLFTELVCTLHDEKTAIFATIWQKVDEALHAAQTTTLWVCEYQSQLEKSRHGNVYAYPGLDEAMRCCQADLYAPVIH